jgi:aryl-alcohol dehydrogenase-like predicted oxidoreductase
METNVVIQQMKTKSEKIDMKTKRLGNSDLFITPVGFGAWAIGGSGWEFGWGEQDDKESITAIHRALELGVNWIDTAAVYGMGHSEEVVARALQSWSGPRPYVFTKCGLRWDEQGYVHRDLGANSIRQECDESLRRLDVDVIDLYQIHWPTDNLEEGWSTMAQLQKEGKVRWIGVSNFSVEELRRARKIAPVTSLQPPYSLVHRAVEEEILPYCRSNGIGVIVYSPMASGLLTGAMTRERAGSLPASDWRSRDVEFKDPRLSRNLALVERLREVGERVQRPPGQVAIAWTLRNPAVTGAIVGARNAKQVEGNVDAATLRLTKKEIVEIEGKRIYEPELVNAA